MYGLVFSNPDKIDEENFKSFYDVKRFTWIRVCDTYIISKVDLFIIVCTTIIQ